MLDPLTLISNMTGQIGAQFQNIFGSISNIFNPMNNPGQGFYPGGGQQSLNGNFTGALQDALRRIESETRQLKSELQDLERGQGHRREINVFNHAVRTDSGNGGAIYGGGVFGQGWPGLGGGTNLTFY